jgi:hypothetical protein
LFGKGSSMSGEQRHQAENERHGGARRGRSEAASG